MDTRSWQAKFDRERTNESGAQHPEISNSETFALSRFAGQTAVAFDDTTPTVDAPVEWSSPPTSLAEMRL